jgi:hypothetical protein
MSWRGKNTNVPLIMSCRREERNGKCSHCTQSGVDQCADHNRNVESERCGHRWFGCLLVNRFVCKIEILLDSYTMCVLSPDALQTNNANRLVAKG